MGEALLQEVAGRRDDLISLTQDLIRMPTLNPPGENYLEICEYLDRRLRREGKRPGECVHFNSHIDVVEAGHGWSVDPFGGEVKGARIYGRGSCDMKGGLAASIIAVEAFIAVCPDYAGSLPDGDRPAVPD